MRPIKGIDPRKLVERIRASTPEELRERPQWVLFKIGDDRKIPISPHGGYASCSDSSTWTVFEHAAEIFLQKSNVCRGFNVATGNGLGGLDLDDVIGSDGGLDDRYRRILGHLGSYTEFSPSRTGLHCFFIYTGEGPQNRKTKDVELYFRAHFLSVTGDVFEGRHKLRDATIGSARVEHALRPRMPLLPRVPMKDVPQNDAELLEKMFASRRGAMIRRLWDGECLHKSDSESDFALMGDLGYWTGGDCDRMIALFLTSGRAERAKGRRADYLKRMAHKVTR